LPDRLPPPDALGYGFSDPVPDPTTDDDEFAFPTEPIDPSDPDGDAANERFWRDLSQRLTRAADFISGSPVSQSETYPLEFGATPFSLCPSTQTGSPLSPTAPAYTPTALSTLNPDAEEYTPIGSPLSPMDSAYTATAFSTLDPAAEEYTPEASPGSSPDTSQLAHLLSQLAEPFQLSQTPPSTAASDSQATPASLLATQEGTTASVSPSQDRVDDPDGENHVILPSPPVKLGLTARANKVDRRDTRMMNTGLRHYHPMKWYIESVRWPFPTLPIALTEGITWLELALDYVFATSLPLVESAVQDPGPLTRQVSFFMAGLRSVARMCKGRVHLSIATLVSEAVTKHGLPAMPGMLHRPTLFYGDRVQDMVAAIGAEASLPNAPHYGTQLVQFGRLPPPIWDAPRGIEPSLDPTVWADAVGNSVGQTALWAQMLQDIEDLHHDPSRANKHILRAPVNRADSIGCQRCATSAPWIKYKQFSRRNCRAHARTKADHPLTVAIPVPEPPEPPSQSGGGSTAHVGGLAPWEFGGHANRSHTKRKRQNEALRQGHTHDEAITLAAWDRRRVVGGGERGARAKRTAARKKLVADGTWDPPPPRQT
jgi:hypothetical protein